MSRLIAFGDSITAGTMTNGAAWPYYAAIHKGQRLRALGAQMVADGIAASICEAGAAIDRVADLLSDGVHPSMYGQINIASSIP